MFGWTKLKKGLTVDRGTHNLLDNYDFTPATKQSHGNLSRKRQDNSTTKHPFMNISNHLRLSS